MGKSPGPARAICDSYGAKNDGTPRCAGKDLQGSDSRKDDWEGRHPGFVRWRTAETCVNIDDGSGGCVYAFGAELTKGPGAEALAMSVRPAITPAPVEVATAVEGFRLWPGALDAAAQAALAATVFARLRQAPPYRPLTPGGRPFSVEMSNFGPLGWVSDRAGYRYQAIHPETGRPWPAIPSFLLDLWRRTVDWPGLPDACLVNLYREGARMGLHQDRDEADYRHPIVSVSLGLPATFQFGGLKRNDPVKKVPLRHGDVVVWGGPSRLVHHGVLTLKDGEHPATGRCRFNLTMRRAL